MLKKSLNLKGVLLAVVLLSVSPFCFGQSSEQKNTRPAITQKDAVKEKDKKDARRIKQAQNIVQDLIFSSNDILDPIVRIKVRMLVADACWDSDPEKARQILSAEFPKIALLTAPQNQADFGTAWSSQDSEKPPLYKGRPIEQVKAQLRSEMLAIVSSRDAALARSLVAANRPKENTSDQHADLDEVLGTANNLAETDPEAAVRIIKESLDSGVDEGLVFLLIRLRVTSPVEASAIFNQVFSGVKAKGDLWGFQRLLPYVLPTELERLVGGRHYLTDTQRMKDATTVIDYAAELLYRRIQTEAPGNLAPELVRREYYMWRNLLALFNDLKPEGAWLVNSRLRQLAVVLPQSAQRAPQGAWSEERENQLLASANSSSGEKRDEYLTSAAFNAWRGGQGDLDHTISLAEKVENMDRKNLTMGTIYFQAGLKYLRSEGPDHALGLARKIELPGYRVRLYLAIIGVLTSVKAAERTEALREELLNWLRGRDKSADTAWAVLDYLDGSAHDRAERNFAAFEILVRVLNSPNLHPDNKPANRIYWYPEFHDFRKSLAPLARVDFDKGLEIIQMLNNREVAMQIQAAFCGGYLKTHKTKRPPLPKLVSQSMN